MYVNGTHVQVHSIRNISKGVIKSLNQDSPWFRQLNMFVILALSFYMYAYIVHDAFDQVIRSGVGSMMTVSL